jgi:hypothetical protein
MHGPINVKSPNNTSKWQLGFNSAFNGLRKAITINVIRVVARKSPVLSARKAITSIKQFLSIQQQKNPDEVDTLAN